MKIRIAVLSFLVSCGILYGADNFVRGHQFDGATGQKTGADLEDLVTLATFAVGSEALDQTTLDDNGAGKARIKDGGVSTAKLADNAVTAAKFRTSAGLSVVGVSSNATAIVADITASSEDAVLRRQGTNLAFGTLRSGAYAAGSVGASAVTNDIMQLTAGASGGGSAGLTEEGPYTSTSSYYGPFLRVGVFEGFANFTSAGAQNIDIEMANDTNGTSTVIRQRINVPAAGANGFTWPWSLIIPKDKYVRVRIVSGTASYYLRYGVLEL